MTDFRDSWRIHSHHPRAGFARAAGAAGAALVAGLASAACAGGGGAASVVELGPPPVRSIEPARTFEQAGVSLRVDSILVGALETEVHLTVRNGSSTWVDTRALRGGRVTAAGQEVRAQAVDGLSAGSPGVVAPGETARGRVRFPPLPAGSLGLRLTLPLVLGERSLSAEFVVRLERGWRRP